LPHLGKGVKGFRSADTEILFVEKHDQNLQEQMMFRSQDLMGGEDGSETRSLDRTRRRRRVEMEMTDLMKD